MRRSRRQERAQKPRQPELQREAGPRFALDRVHAAAVEDRLALGGRRCEALLMPLMGTLLDCRRFAADVLCALRPRDFCRTVRIGDVEWDVYGVELPRALRERYYLGERKTWYVKLSLRAEDPGATVQLVSLHALERPMHRKGGRLEPAE
jgi:hypothetical protein